MGFFHELRRHAAAAIVIDLPGVDGRVVEARRGVVEDPAYTKAKAALDAAQAKRAKKVAVLLENWMSGEIPKPEAFNETQGRKFVELMRENME